MDILVNNAGLARGRWNLCSDRSSFMTGQTLHVDGGTDPRP